MTSAKGKKYRQEGVQDMCVGGDMGAVLDRVWRDLKMKTETQKVWRLFLLDTQVYV